MLKWLWIALSYFIGSISFAYIVAKLHSGIDIRNYGSGNAGATNVHRTLGIKAFAVVSILDILKGYFVVFIAMLITDNQLAIALSALAVILGHNWPILFNFKGGKGIASTLGVVAAFSFLAFIILVVLMAVIIYITRYMSLASLVATLSAPILIFFLSGDSYYFVGITFVLTILAWFTHRQNIIRLLDGQERKIGER
ncbi:glycerol-3-phosphate 1-O-acyltransferase PlsY [Proteinivorax hydrogeniformans]|uniref:Glycerol-3-phosphate acyltransferase n=1 Tax=Proteinivorax hydrogeniformans TaxID=1826727 RepID=A0AAU8HWP2_9FIRM